MHNTEPVLSASDLLVRLAATGVHHFTTVEAVRALRAAPHAVRAALRRLAAKGVIASPYRGFHVIVPPEYRRLGALPAEQFVPALMEHLGETYYAALLSAAELHGAAHQRPQSFQVMVRANRRPIECGRVRVDFFARGDLDRTPIETRNTPRGTLRVSTAEATALELTGYAGACGGIDHVARVVAELAESIDARKLVAAAELAPIAWAQRAGHLLERAGHVELVSELAEYVREHARVHVPLVRSRSMTGAPRAARWRLALNASLEDDA